jgi:hypothetical protein
LAASSQTFLNVRFFSIRAKLDRRNVVPARPRDLASRHESELTGLAGRRHDPMLNEVPKIESIKAV